MVFSSAAGIAATAQDRVRAPRELAPRDLVVSSTLERIGAPPAAGDSAPADAAQPAAEELIVSVRFENSSDHIVDSIRVTSPVPPGLQYVPQSASGPGSEVLFSVDGGKSFGRPGELELAAADGSARAADPADYTHVRFVLDTPLDAGAAGVARFRAVPR